MSKMHRTTVLATAAALVLSAAPPAGAAPADVVVDEMSAVPSVVHVPRTAGSYPFNAADHAREPVDLAAHGYVEEEFFLSGYANVYTKADGTPYPREQCPIHAALRDGVTHRADNDVFWQALRNTLYFALVGGPLTIFIALAAALTGILHGKSASYLSEIMPNTFSMAPRYVLETRAVDGSLVSREPDDPEPVRRAMDGAVAQLTDDPFVHHPDPDLATAWHPHPHDPIGPRSHSFGALSSFYIKTFCFVTAGGEC